MPPIKILSLIALLSVIFAAILSFAAILTGWVIPLICLAIILLCIALLM